MPDVKKVKGGWEGVMAQSNLWHDNHPFSYKLGLEVCVSVLTADTVDNA